MNKDTRLVHAGRDPAGNHGIVNPPVYHASTVLFPTVEALAAAARQPFEGVYYGRHGTPTSFAFEEAVAALDGDYHRAISVSSGLAAISTALLALLRQGDHLLMVDTVYGPTRAFCDTVLADLGIETTYYPPRIGAGIAELLRPNTQVVFTESPGSLTFELQDIPAIKSAVGDITVVLDNTWATGLFYSPFERGVDVCLQAATKYIVGHADAMLGVLTCRDEAMFKRLKTLAVRLGQCAGPEVCYLGQRGLRSLSARLERHQRSGLAMAQWFAERDEVAQVLHPALPDSPDHALWQRDYSGATGLFGVVLKPQFDAAAVARMLDGLQLFGMGFSWGGYESLVLPSEHGIERVCQPWPQAEQTLRLHIGLENVADLQADLAAGLARL